MEDKDYKGISYEKRKGKIVWRVRKYKNGKSNYIGRFENFDDALEALKKFSNKIDQLEKEN